MLYREQPCLAWHPLIKADMLNIINYAYQIIILKGSYVSYKTPYDCSTV
jgi:hypothetical protein